MKNEPVALIAAIAVIVVTVASAFKVVLDIGTVETLLLDVLVLAQAVVTRSKVTPTGWAFEDKRVRE